MTFEYSAMDSEEFREALRRCSVFTLEAIELPLNWRTIERSRYFTLDNPPPVILPCTDPNCQGGGIMAGRYVMWLIDRKQRHLAVPGYNGFDMADIVVCPGMTRSETGALAMCRRHYQLRLRCVLGEPRMVAGRLNLGSRLA